jgi:hypothetical protein
MTNAPVSNLEASCQSTRASKTLAITQLVAGFNATDFDHVRFPFMASQARDSREHILNITMAPVLAFDLGDRRNIPRAKSFSLCW